MNAFTDKRYRNTAAMALQEVREEINSAKRQAMGSTSYLWTPPENVGDSFSRDDGEKMAVVERWQEPAGNKLPPLQAHTPPASPEMNTLPSIAAATGYSSSHDSPLFSDDSQRDQAASQTPLFEREREQSPSPLTNYQYPESAVRSSISREPQPEAFPACLGVRTEQDARQYYEDRLAEFRRLRAYQLPSPRYSASAERDRETRRQIHSLSKPAHVSKPRSTSKTVAKPKAPVSTSPVKTSPPKRRTPKARTIPDFVDAAFPSTSQGTKHKRAPPSKKVEGDNVNWAELPDYAPSTSTLDLNPKSLKASWHGNPLDLSADPDRAHCHPQELAVAGTLRLSVAQYLTNKRKIFQARLQSIKDGKNFTKTAAQAACSIDVNKASQLWEAFDRVGWLKESWFQQFL